ncbi:leucine--tRNA ligase [Candidatus Saccharibacteria bacterium]|nr:leucine--tRNA ligase [Candidatus Saccharibacteria bacterium]
MRRYNPTEIEPKWQQIWADDTRYQSKDFDARPKYYVTGMFPYPSGAGMHIGHFFEHSIVDAVARFRRALGHNVVYPMGWDSFGLPAENYAIKTGTAPAVVTKQNIANFKNQLTRVGASIDWSREINTTDPEYYKWTQWVFTQMFERGLAYQKESLQWWCPVDKTVLANEQVEAGRCWRCGTEVEKKSMKQWFFKITEYADELLEEIPNLNWPEKIKTAQANWIGRSQGAEIDFAIDGSDDTITVFSTRPDTLFGASFLVLAPEHPLARKLATDEMRESVHSYIDEAVKKSEIERQSEGKEKTGVWTGSYAINPVNSEQAPIWVADYVLGGYGTGAVMGVPAHDERDFAFAQKFELPVVRVVVQDFGSILPDSVNVTGPVVIGYDPNTKEFMSLRNKNVNDRRWLVAGGLNEGESYEEAARRELKEEAGFSDIVKLISLGEPTNSYYYNSNKNSNRRSHSFTFLAILDKDLQGEQQQESNENYEVVWGSSADIEEDFIKEKNTSTEDGISHWIEAIQRARQAAEAYDANETYKPNIYSGEGSLINSGVFDGMSSSEAREEIVAWLEQQAVGRSKVTYKMRDWLISRQRYWGAPIPVIHCDEHGAVPVPTQDLPVVLPEIEDYAPKGDGKSALARQTDWVNTTCPTCGKPAQRETDTMDGYACSSWYLLRYTDPHNDEQAWDPKKADYWSPVDMYVGGDHAVAHLLYVRFWNHVFYDLGLVPVKEPVKQLVYHGLIQAEDGTKMSKSKGNVVDPLEVIDAGYGADALRTFELFLGPINENSSWSSKGIAGVYRFLNRLWTLVQEYDESDKSGVIDAKKLESLTHQTIKKVTGDVNRLSFNTAIAGLMEHVNELYKLKTNGFTPEWQVPLEALVQLVQPFAPHMAAELWQQLGHDTQLDFVEWPTWDDAKIASDAMTIIVQVNGKLRAKLEVASDASDDDIKQAALADAHVQQFVGDKKPTKVIYVPGRLVSIVV